MGSKSSRGMEETFPANSPINIMLQAHGPKAIKWVPLWHRETRRLSQPVWPLQGSFLPEKLEGVRVILTRSSQRPQQVVEQWSVFALWMEHSAKVMSQRSLKAQQQLEQKLMDKRAEHRMFRDELGCPSPLYPVCPAQAPTQEDALDYPAVLPPSYSGPPQPAPVHPSALPHPTIPSAPPAVLAPTLLEPVSSPSISTDPDPQETSAPLSVLPALPTHQQALALRRLVAHLADPPQDTDLPRTWSGVAQAQRPALQSYEGGEKDLKTEKVFTAQALSCPRAREKDEVKEPLMNTQIATLECQGEGRADTSVVGDNELQMAYRQHQCQGPTRGPPREGYVAAPAYHPPVPQQTPGPPYQAHTLLPQQRPALLQNSHYGFITPLGRDQCLYCKEYGHWKHECPVRPPRPTRYQLQGPPRGLSGQVPYYPYSVYPLPQLDPRVLPLTLHSWSAPRR